jgi:hypothetical protein
MNHTPELAPEQVELTPEQSAALNRVAAQYGRNWKSKLRLMWMNGRDALRPDGGYLRQVRNQQPPSFLDKYKPAPVTQS